MLRVKGGLQGAINLKSSRRLRKLRYSAEGRITGPWTKGGIGQVADEIDRGDCCSRPIWVDRCNGDRTEKKIKPGKEGRFAVRQVKGRGKSFRLRSKLGWGKRPETPCGKLRKWRTGRRKRVIERFKSEEGGGGGGHVYDRGG